MKEPMLHGFAAFEGATICAIGAWLLIDPDGSKVVGAVVFLAGMTLAALALWDQ